MRFKVTSINTKIKLVQFNYKCLLAIKGCYFSYILILLISRTEKVWTRQTMSYKASQMNKREAVLLEHVHAVVRILDIFKVKDNISSKHVLRRLDYLHNKLSDFLDQELCNDNEPSDSHSWQQTGEELPVSKYEELAAALPSIMPENTPSMEALGDVQYVCGLCEHHIMIYNSDHKLSMDLHYQTDAHQQALKSQKMKAAQTAMLETLRPIETKSKLISKTAAKRSIVGRACEGNADKHVTGRSHERGPTKPREAGCEMVITDKGMFHCQLCGVSVSSSSCALQHKQGKLHLQKLLARNLVPLIEDKFWSKIPEGCRDHRKYFQSSGDTSVKCKACMVYVPKTVINVLSHIRGKKHSHILPGWA
jgi:hypothetical protein